MEHLRFACCARSCSGRTEENCFKPMHKLSPFAATPKRSRALVAVLLLYATLRLVSAAPLQELEAGVAVRDVTPPDPIYLAGYAARNHPSERVDIPLVV